MSPADGNIHTLTPPRLSRSLTDAEEEFESYVRETYQWNGATRQEVNSEIATMAQIGDVIAEAAKRIMELRGKLNLACDYTRQGGSRTNLTVNVHDLAMSIVDSVFLGQGETVLREHTRRALGREEISKQPRSA